jgi:thioredoxin-related protein
MQLILLSFILLLILNALIPSVSNELDDQLSPMDIAKEAISSNKIMVFSKTYCKYKHTSHA